MKQVQILQSLTLVLLVILVASCSKTTDPSPTGTATNFKVTTDRTSIRYENGAIVVKGSVGSSDNYTILEKGVTFSTSALQKVNATATLAGPGTGEFTTSTTGLNLRSALFVRAFAISKNTDNKIDTTYGNEVSFFGLHRMKNLSFSNISDLGLTFTFEGVKLDTIPGLTTIKGKGICWGTSPGPTSKPGFSQTFEGADTSGFTGTVSNLNAATIYYFRTYAINEADTSFSADFVVSTGLRDFSSNLYQTKKIGNQLWMAENLKSSTFSNGEAIVANPVDFVWSNTILPSFDDSLTGFGNLYNYYAVVDARNLCPTGWHVPTGADWNTLFESQGGWNIAGLKLKDNTTAWGSSILTGQGSSGFRAIPAGLKESSGAIRLVNKFGYWWAKPTGSESPTAVWINNVSLEAFTGASGAQQGLSVRCVKD